MSVAVWTGIVGMRLPVSVWRVPARSAMWLIMVAVVLRPPFVSNHRAVFYAPPAETIPTVMAMRANVLAVAVKCASWAPIKAVTGIPPSVIQALTAMPALAVEGILTVPNPQPVNV